ARLRRGYRAGGPSIQREKSRDRPCPRRPDPAMNDPTDAGMPAAPKTSPDAPPATSDSSTRSARLIVFLVVFIDLLGFGIVLPLLPLYATDLLKPLFPGEEAGDRLLRGGILGVLMASFSFIQFVAAPLWGRLSDRIGRRPVLLVGLGGSVFFY